MDKIKCKQLVWYGYGIQETMKMRKTAKMEKFGDRSAGSGEDYNGQVCLFLTIGKVLEKIWALRLTYYLEVSASSTGQREPQRPQGEQ